MLHIIPTYRVEYECVGYRPDDSLTRNVLVEEKGSMRVPENRLEDFFHVLKFNGLRRAVIELEPDRVAEANRPILRADER